MTKFIGVWTMGMMELSSDMRERVEKEFYKASAKVDDYFYAIEVDGQKFFVVDNGEMGYTAMIPNEY